MEDEHLMSPAQQRLVLTIVDALNRNIDVHAAARALTPAPDPADVATALRILELEPIAYQLGERAEAVLARILSAIETLHEGGQPTPPRAHEDEFDDRY